MAVLYDVCQRLMSALLQIGEIAQEPIFEDSSFFKFIEGVAHLMPSTLLRSYLLDLVYSLTEIPFIFLIFGAGIWLIICIKIARFVVSLVFG